MKDELTLQISETFYSIQGESTYAGLPCFFIRLADCNLRCNYCDARYTYEEPGKTVSIKDLLAQAADYPKAIVEITGGEPLLQENVYPLMEGLLAAGRTVLLETNGSVDISRVPEKVIKIVDMKCPESGMAEKMDLENLNRLAKHDEVKFVVSSEADYSWAKQLIEEYQLTQKATVLFSPIIGKVKSADLAQWLLTDQLQARIQLQLHTFLWPDETRGF